MLLFPIFSQKAILDSIESPGIHFSSSLSSSSSSEFLGFGHGFSHGFRPNSGSGPGFASLSGFGFDSGSIQRLNLPDVVGHEVKVRHVASINRSHQGVRVFAMEHPQRMADLVGSSLDQVSHKSLFPGILNVQKIPTWVRLTPTSAVPIVQISASSKCRSPEMRSLFGRKA